MPLGSPNSGGLLNIATSKWLDRALSAGATNNKQRNNNTTNRQHNNTTTSSAPQFSTINYDNPPSPFRLTESRLQSVPTMNKPSKCNITPH